MTRRTRFHLGGLGARVRTAHLFALTVLPDRPQPVDRPIALRPTLYHHFDHGLLMNSRAAGVKPPPGGVAEDRLTPIDQMDKRSGHIADP